MLRHEIGIRKTLQSIVSLVSFFLFVFYMVQLDDPPLNIVEILNMTPTCEVGLRKLLKLSVSNLNNKTLNGPLRRSKRVH